MGRNALYLAANGFSVTAVDISRVALDRGRRAAAERGLTLEWLYADLDEDPDSVLPSGNFDLVVWARYVHKTLMQHLVVRLGLGGALVCEQHLRTDLIVAGPSSAEFR